MFVDPYLMSKSVAARRERLRFHTDLEARVLAYLIERENPGSTPENRYAYLRGQADLILFLRDCAIQDSIDD